MIDLEHCIASCHCLIVDVILDLYIVSNLHKHEWIIKVPHRVSVRTAFTMSVPISHELKPIARLISQVIIFPSNIS